MRSKIAETRGFWGAASGGRAKFLCTLKINRNELTDAAFAHRHAEQTIHVRHSDAVMSNDKEPRVSGTGNFTEQAAKSFNIGVV